jgi:hypothetical protein
MSVTILSPSCSRSSATTVWWSNPVAALPDRRAGQVALDQGGTIHTLGGPPNCGEFSGVNATTMICASPVRYTWVEGDFIGRTSGDSPVIHPLLYRGPETTVVDVTTSASYYGVRAFHADYTTVAAVTSVNTAGAGLAFVEPWNKGYNTIHNVAVSHVSGDSAILVGDRFTTLGQLAADGASASCISVGDYNGESSRLKFTGNVLVGTGNPVCSMTSKGVDPGLSTTNGCSSQGLSDAGWRLGSSLKASFVGGLTATDPANASNTNGAENYPAITDWWSFGNRFRMWGADGDAATRCSTTCRIYDWSLRAAVHHSRRAHAERALRRRGRLPGAPRG